MYAPHSSAKLINRLINIIQKAASGTPKYKDMVESLSGSMLPTELKFLKDVGGTATSLAGLTNGLGTGSKMQSEKLIKLILQMDHFNKRWILGQALSGARPGET